MSRTAVPSGDGAREGIFMAKLEGRASINVAIVMVLSEAEAAALDALAGYGVEPFLEVFYKHLGESYLKPYESGLRSLFESVRSGPASVSGTLDKLKDARGVFIGTHRAIRVE